MVLTAAGGAVEPRCATAVSSRMTAGVSVGAYFSSHGAAVAGPRPIKAGRLQQRLCGDLRYEVDCDRGCVRRLRASGVRLMQQRRGAQQRQFGCSSGGVGPSSGSSAAAAAAWGPAAAVRLQQRRRGGQQRHAHPRLLQQWCRGQCYLCCSSSNVVFLHAILLLPCIMLLAVLLVFEIPLGGFLQGWPQG